MSKTNIISISEFGLERPLRPDDPTSELGLLHRQGEWTEADYLALDTNQLIEFSDGSLEFLPMPTLFHQNILKFIYELLNAFVTGRRLGVVYFAPLPVKLWDGKLREPDLVFIRPGRISDVHVPPNGADLALEVVSDSPRDRQRDLQTKREEYAKAGIKEYWIVDPQEQQISVLVLDAGAYREHGIFKAGTFADSVLLSGFSVPVDDVFAAADAIYPADE